MPLWHFSHRQKQEALGTMFFCPVGNVLKSKRIRHFFQHFRICLKASPSIHGNASPIDDMSQGLVEMHRQAAIHIPVLQIAGIPVFGRHTLFYAWNQTGV